MMGKKPSEPTERPEPVKGRRWGALLRWLPVVFLLGWFCYEQALFWITPAPRWIISENGFATSAGCADLGKATGDKYGFTTADPPPVTRLSARRATSIADRVIARYLGRYIWFQGHPVLAQATLPDGQDRLVWSDFRVIGPAPLASQFAGTGGEVLGLYIDATSGEPLLLLTGIIVGDTGFGCGYMGLGPAWLQNLSPSQFLSMSLLGLYLIIWIILSFLTGLVRYRRPSEVDPS